MELIVPENIYTLPGRAKEVLRAGDSKGGIFRGKREWPFEVFFPVFENQNYCFH